MVSGRFGALARGAAAGAISTLAMSGVMGLFHAFGLLGEPPPHKIVRKTMRRSRGQRPPLRTSVPWSVVAHLGYGAALGTVHALLPAKPRTSLPVGGVYGAGVWAVHYAGLLPALGIMPRPQADRQGRPWAMVAAHLAFGTALALTERVLETFRPREPAVPRTTRSIELQRAIRGPRMKPGPANL